MSVNQFSLTALYTAIDDERRARGASWTAAVRDISLSFTQAHSRSLAVSTVTGLRTKAVAEGDGVLQMLHWLDRTPESFIKGASRVPGAPLPRAGPRDVLRCDTRRLHAAIDAVRLERGLTWAEVAREIGGSVGASTLVHLSRGGRTSFPHVMHITQWLGAPLADFVRVTRR